MKQGFELPQGAGPKKVEGVCVVMYTTVNHVQCVPQFVRHAVQYSANL